MLVAGDVAFKAERSACSKEHGPTVRQISASSFAAIVENHQVNGVEIATSG